MSGTGRERLDQWEFWMLGCSLLALGLVAATSVLPLDVDTRVLLRWADNFVCAVFLADFLRSLRKEPDTWRYLRTVGWLDLVSSVPVFTSLRLARLARVWRIVRVIRGARAAGMIAEFILGRRSRSAPGAVALLGLLLVVFGSVAILELERDGGGSINGPADALWWSVAAVTTADYGDRFPVTDAGRVVAGILMLGGVCLLGTLSGMAAAWFEREQSDRTQAELLELRREIEALRRDLRGRSEGSAHAASPSPESRFEPTASA